MAAVTSSHEPNTSAVFTIAPSITNKSDSCNEVLPFQIFSLTFTFLVEIFLAYVITALCYYGYKKKLMIGCGGN